MAFSKPVTQRLRLVLFCLTVQCHLPSCFEVTY